MQALSGLLAMSCLSPAHADAPVAAQLCADTAERFGTAFDRLAPEGAARFDSLSDAERYSIVAYRLETVAGWWSGWIKTGLLTSKESEPVIKYSAEAHKPDENDVLVLAGDGDQPLDDFGVLDRMERCMAQAGAFDPVARKALESAVPEEERIMLASSTLAVSAATNDHRMETIGDLEAMVCQSEFRDAAKSLYGLGGYRSVADFYVAEYETEKAPVGFGTVIEGMMSLAQSAATIRNEDLWNALHACLSGQLGGQTQ